MQGEQGDYYERLSTHGKSRRASNLGPASGGEASGFWIIAGKLLFIDQLQLESQGTR
jgi:hypothetical protein